jgi:hypothetical protein
MHTTTTGDKIKTLQKEALELVRKAKAAKRTAKTLPEVTDMARELQSKADKAHAEALELKPLARLEDLRVANGDDQDHKERIQKIHLLDGHMARRRQNPKCPSRELRNDR